MQGPADDPVAVVSERLEKLRDVVPNIMTAEEYLAADACVKAPPLLTDEELMRELARLREPLAALAAETGLAVEPGRFVLELRPPGTDKGTALRALVSEHGSRAVLFCGDDLGDLAAFAAVRELRANGVPGCAVGSRSEESPQVAAAADLVVDGPSGVVRLLAELAGAVGGAA